MRLSAKSLKWLMRFYPPLLINRIWVITISDDFTHARVKIAKSFLNSNFNRSIFGGTIYSAGDPFFALLVWGIFNKKNYKVKVWLKSATIKFLKPAHTDLFVEFRITPDEVNKAEEDLLENGKYIQSFSIDVKDVNGIVCAQMNTEVYARNIGVNYEYKEADTRR